MFCLMLAGGHKRSDGRVLAGRGAAEERERRAGEVAIHPSAPIDRMTGRELRRGSGLAGEWAKGRTALREAEEQRTGRESANVHSRRERGSQLVGGLVG